MKFVAITQYGMMQLTKVAFYRVCYKLKLRLFKIRVPKIWSKPLTKNVLSNDFTPFFSSCYKKTDRIVKEAENIIGGEVILFGKVCKIDSIHGWLNDPVTGGIWDPNAYFIEAPTKQDGLADVKYVLELNKFDHLVKVALAYHYTHDKKYTRFITGSIRGYRETVKPYRSIVQRIIMDMGFRIINLIQILLLCKDDEEFQHDTTTLINGILFDQVKAIESFHTAKWFKTGNGANHVTGEMVGLILGQLWLQCNGIAKYDKKYKEEYAYLVEVLNRTIAPSGAYLEQSGNYSRLVAEFLVIFDLLKDCMGHYGYYKPYEEGNYRCKLLQYVRDIAYHDYVPNFGDNDDARVLTALRGHNEEVEYFLNDIKPSNQPNKYLDGSQWVYRSQDANDVYLFVRVGKFAYFREGASIHAHNDLLAVLMGVKGVPVFVDRGMLFYNSGIGLRKSYSRMMAHNTLSLDGIEMNNLGFGVCYKYPHCEYEKNEIGDNVVFSGLLKYDNIDHKRRIFYSDGLIEIEDVLYLNDNNNAVGSIRYLLHPNIKVEKDKGAVILTLNNGTEVTVSIMGAEEIKLVDVDFSPTYGQTAITSMIEGRCIIKGESTIKTVIKIK